MHTQFLCSNHRQWLSSEPQSALDCWHDWMDRGQMHVEALQWQKAIPFLGCAYEAADILISQATTEKRRHRAVDLLVFASIQLAEALRHTDKKELRNYYLALSFQRLGVMLSNQDSAFQNHLNRRMNLLLRSEEHQQFIVQPTLTPFCEVLEKSAVIH